MRTSDKLAAELRKVAEQTLPENAAKYEAFAVRARTAHPGLVLWELADGPHDHDHL